MKNKERRENRQTYYDERQLIERSKSYELFFECACLITIVFYILCGFLQVNISPIFALISCLFVSLTVCEIRMVLTDSWEYTEPTKRKILLNFGWIILFVLWLLLPVMKNMGVTDFYRDLVTNSRSGYAATIFLTGNRAIVAIVYYIKFWCDRKKLKAEEEENEE